MRLALIATAALCVSSLAAHADSIVLDSVNNGTYVYGVQHTGEIDYNFGSTVTFSNLYGVTGASASGFDATSITSTSVTFTQDSQILPIFYTGSGEVTDLFTITSASGVSGLASYVSNSDPAFAGSVAGPVAPTLTSVTPEPSSFALLGTGLLGIAGVVRKRFA